MSDELYVDGPPGTVCPDCGRVTETVSEENYFFKLSAFERKLLEFYEANPGFMGPESTRREVISFVRGGLRDLSVSRTSFSWGIPVPGDEKHVIYVWLDALANYITALGYGSDDPADQARFEKFWPADLHLIGKEISRFHCVYWPAFLMAAGIPLPRSVMANGWLLFDQGKMSKSRGNVVRAETVLEVLGADALRYFLLREIPFGQDGGFSFDALVQRYNGDLANGYGNLVSRVVNMVHKYFGGVVPKAGAETAAEAALRECAEKTIAEFGPAFDELNFSEALKALWILVAETDGYLTANAPWKKPADRSEADHTALQARVLATAAEAIRIITALVYPILPDAAAKVWRQLGPGRDCRCGKEIIFDETRVGRIEGRDEIWRARAALSPRGKGRHRTYAKHRRSKQHECGGSRQRQLRPPVRMLRLRRKRLPCRKLLQSNSRPKSLTAPKGTEAATVKPPVSVAVGIRLHPLLQPYKPRHMRRSEPQSAPPQVPQSRRRSPSTMSSRSICAWRKSSSPSAFPRPTSCCAWRSIWATRSGRFWPASRNTTSRKSSLAARSSSSPTSPLA